MWPAPQVFDPRQATLVYRRNLPHWRQPGAAYFVTFRLADSVPDTVVRRWAWENQQWLADQTSPLTDELREEQANRFGRRLLLYLDGGHGNCPLKSTAARGHVAKALLHFDGERYLLGAYAIMPNHAHALVMPLGRQDLTDVVASWMKFSAKQINIAAGQSGTLWQGEPFDHIVRDRVAYRRFTKYIEDNPRRLAKDHAECGCGLLKW